MKGFLSTSDIKDAQRKDGEIIQHWIRLIQGGGIGIEREVKESRFFKNLVMDENGLLRMVGREGNGEAVPSLGNSCNLKVVVPRSMIAEVIDFVHESPLGGHMGYKRTYKRCRETFWWQKMGKDINLRLKRCEQCGKNKHETHPNKAPLQVMDIPEKAFDKLQVDFLGPFQASPAHTYRYALQVQDILSRFLTFIPTEKDDAETAATVVFEKWVCRYGPPKIIQSDRGTHFASQVFQAMCSLAGIKHKMGSPGHAHSQGQVERQNQLMNQVRYLAENNRDKWPRALPRIAYVHNISENETTGIAPYQVVFAEVPRTVERVGLEVQRGVEDEGRSLFEQFERRAEARRRLGEHAWRTTREAQVERAANCPTRGEKYRVGDKVRIKLSVAERGKLGGKKLAPLNSDVYRVQEVHGEGWTYTLSSENGIGRQVKIYISTV